MILYVGGAFEKLERYDEAGQAYKNAYSLNPQVFTDLISVFRFGLFCEDCCYCFIFHLVFVSKSR